MLCGHHVYQAESSRFLTAQLLPRPAPCCAVEQTKRDGSALKLSPQGLVAGAYTAGRQPSKGARTVQYGAVGLLPAQRLAELARSSDHALLGLVAREGRAAPARGQQRDAPVGLTTLERGTAPDGGREAD